MATFKNDSIVQILLIGNCTVHKKNIQLLLARVPERSPEVSSGHLAKL